MKVAGPPVGASGPFGPIQVIPPGLTGLLQLKQTGRLPDKLSDVVAGVIELRDWYLTARRVDVFDLFSNAAAPATAALVTGGIGTAPFNVGGSVAQVPKGELWYVEQYSASTPTTAAADSLSFGMIIRNNTNTTLLEVGPIANDVVTARNRLLSAKADRGFWAFPGDQFAILVQDIVASVSFTVTMAMRATRCPI